MSARRPHEQAIIDEANAMTDGAHHPALGVEYHPGARKYGAQCAGCDYWTGYGTKTAVAKQILAHCRAKADDPGMTELEIAQARVTSLRASLRHIGGRGARRKKDAMRERIATAERAVARLEAVAP